MALQITPIPVVDPTIPYSKPGINLSISALYVNDQGNGISDSVDATASLQITPFRVLSSGKIERRPDLADGVSYPSLYTACDPTPDPPLPAAPVNLLTNAAAQTLSASIGAAIQTYIAAVAPTAPSGSDPALSAVTLTIMTGVQAFITAKGL